MSPSPPPLPEVLDLAPLPRAQIGPFLILGVDKDVDRDTLEANWATPHLGTQEYDQVPA